MVFNHDLIWDKTLIHTILVADLTPEQLDTVQAKFGDGATMMTPHPQWQLFIEDRREWASRSHADMKRSYPDTRPLLVVDAHTPDDGGVWYIDRFADDDDMEEEQAENKNTLFKLRMRLEDVVIIFINIDMSNMSLEEYMYEAKIPFPVPENFTQENRYSLDFDPIKDRYVAGSTRITATPDDMEQVPNTQSRYRLKESVAKALGLKCIDYEADERPVEDQELPDGTLVKFPEGSKEFRCDYDPEFAVPVYCKPAGSL